MKITDAARARGAESKGDELPDDYTLDFDWGWEVIRSSNGQRLSCAMSEEEAIEEAKNPRTEVDAETLNACLLALRGQRDPKKALESLHRLKPEGSCCFNERRNANGSCDSCGDPCL